MHPGRSAGRRLSRVGPGCCFGRGANSAGAGDRPGQRSSSRFPHGGIRVVAGLACGCGVEHSPLREVHATLRRNHVRELTPEPLVGQSLAEGGFEPCALCAFPVATGRETHHGSWAKCPSVALNEHYLTRADRTRSRGTHAQEPASGPRGAAGRHDVSVLSVDEVHHGRTLAR